jgi:hypothetical protein
MDFSDSLNHPRLERTAFGCRSVLRRWRISSQTMNCRYFACADCKQYIDAGYRWAYWLLEHPGIVRLGEPVSASAVLATADYWTPPPDEQSD